MTNRAKGGKWALAGYLYQLIGQHSLTVRVVGNADTPNKVSEDEAELSLLLSGFDSDSATLAEALGQDAALVSRDSAVLVQFKYSTSGRRIGRREIEEIIANLVNDAREASKQKAGTVACMLVTNRALASQAQQYWDDTARDREAGYGLFLEHRSMAESIRSLNEFGMDYGATREEGEWAIDFLLGRVFREIGEGKIEASLTKANFVEAFTGTRDGRPLTVASIVDIAQKALKEYGAHHLLSESWDGYGVRRDVHEDLLRATHEHALVIVSGPGGCGKSMLVWRLMSEISESETGGCALDLAEHVVPDWIVGTVNRWRNIGPSVQNNDTPDLAIDRVVIANMRIPKPIIYLGLDGLDEHTESSGNIAELRSVVRRFWRREQERADRVPPSATLLLSCRDENDVLKNWLGLPPDAPVTSLKHIQLDAFSEAEFSEATRRAVPDLYDELVEEQSHQPARGWLEGLTQDIGLAEPSLSAHGAHQIDPGVREILFHPVMWRGLLALELAERERVMKGGADEISALVDEFIKWFHYKLRRRELQLADLNLDDFRQILRVVAEESNHEGINDRDEAWINPACSTHKVSDKEALALYRETLSIGLIDESSRTKWLWRSSYLARTIVRARGGEC